MNILWEVPESKKKAIPHVARTALSISSVRGQVDGGSCHMGFCDSAPGTDDYPAKTLDAVFGYGAVVAAPCCQLVSTDMSIH